MIVNTYNDHVAYIFEANENISPLGNRVMSKMNKDYIMKYSTVIYNGRPKLLYGAEDLKVLNNIIATLPEAEIIGLLKQFLDVVCTVNDNDFINLYAIDVNFNRLYYNAKLQLLKCIIIPVNENYDFHENVTWQEKYRNTLVMFCSQIFRSQPERYSEMYYKIMDMSKSDGEIAYELLNYDFGLTRAGESTTQIFGDNMVDDGRIMFLEHYSELGNLLFRISQKEYIIGKSVNSAHGVINISTSVSRKHCAIRKEDGGFTIEDLGSSNGTSVNGFGLEPGVRYMLNEGDVVQLADVVFGVRVE